MQTRYLLCLLGSLLFLSPGTARAQEKSYKGNYWFGLGLGKSQFPSGMMALGYEFTNRPTLIVARYVANGELFSDRQPGISVNELGLLYGIRTGKFRFSTGLSGVWGTYRGQLLSTDPDPLIYGTQYYERIDYKTVGIPAEIRFLTSTKDVGVGLTGFGNLNGKRSFVGLNLSVYLGKMK
jgi:hypothetical protein